MRGEWIRKPQSDTSVIFVHGVLSSGETCWRHDNRSYWPHLLQDEPELAQLGIYVFTYETGIFSGSYRISDIVDALKEHMQLDGVLESKQLIFVCHSMGGIVARKFIVERAADLIRAGKEIGLFLVASPSLGTGYADWLSPLAQLFGHAEADALRFVRNNGWLKDLDKEFMNLKEGGTLKIKGKELVEDKFIFLPKLFRRQVVEPFTGAKYFGDPYKVPASDHFSIAKPNDKNAIQHRLLCKFILENVRLPGQEAVNGSTVADLFEGEIEESVRLKALVRLPLGPAVDPFEIKLSIKRAFAGAGGSVLAAPVIGDAGKLVLATLNPPPKNTHAYVVTPDQLPNSQQVALLDYWSAVFNQACALGPRMVGALLLLAPPAAVHGAKTDIAELFAKLEVV